MDTEEAKIVDVELEQDNGKRKRAMSEKQLKALEEGRKKRWLSKQIVKEEPTTTSASEEDTTDQSSSETDQSKTETETEGEPSTADESVESSATNTNTDKTDDSDSSEEEDDDDEDEEDEEKDEEVDSEDSEPPSPPVLRRQKATINEYKNKQATAKMMIYLEAKTNPYFTHMYV